MGTAARLPDKTRVFIQRLDDAVAAVEPRAICDGLGAILGDAVSLAIPDAYLEPATDGYARRLLHRCPELDYSVMVMVWGPGQGTPVHDHAGKWCVEGVVEGQIEITGYRPTSDPAADLVHFEPTGTVTGNPGDVGVLVPPNEYHSIRNVGDRKAVTVHVYAGEMLWCHAFHPVRPGVFRRERCTLTYTPFGDA